MKIRVIIPTLGRSPWLVEALGSTVLNVGMVEKMIVAPEEEVASLMQTCADALILSQSGKGLYAALNTGFREPGGWAVGTWLNDDDRLVPEGFATAIALLQSQPQLAAVYGRVSLINAGGHYLAEIPSARFDDDLGPLLASGLVPLAQPGTVFRRDVFEQLGGFDESLKAAGDLSFFQRALAAGFKFGFIDAHVAEFRVHKGQISQQVETRLRETAAVMTAAREVLGWSRIAGAARWRFRWSNLSVYADRVRRHGFVSMEQLMSCE